jgi:hypothetical protein
MSSEVKVRTDVREPMDLQDIRTAIKIMVSILSSRRVLRLADTGLSVNYRAGGATRGWVEPGNNNGWRDVFNRVDFADYPLQLIGLHPLQTGTRKNQSIQASGHNRG